MARNAQIGRSTVESWIAIILSALPGIVEMSWQWELALLALVFWLLCDIIFHSARTFRLWSPAKVILALAALIAVATIGLPSLSARYLLAHHTGHLPSWLAAIAVTLKFINRPVWLAVCFLAMAVIVFWEALPVWRLRHFLAFRWRRALAEEVWIGPDAAAALVENSEWMSARDDSPSWTMSMALALKGMRGQTLRAKRFVQMALDAFEQGNPSRVRVVEGVKQYSEEKLRAYLAAAFDHDVIEKLGKPPNIPV